LKTQETANAVHTPIHVRGKINVNRFCLAFAWRAASLLVLAACAERPSIVNQTGEVHSQASCSLAAEQGCACAPGSPSESCFLPDTWLEHDQVMCSEGTRTCRGGVWSGCENTHEYLFRSTVDTQRIINPTAFAPTCSICDPRCFKAIDNLRAADGTGGGNVTFAPGGGLTLLPNDAGTPDAGDAGTGLTGCIGLAVCCAGLTDALNTACTATLVAANNAACDRDRDVYCPSEIVTGPVTGCTVGSGADSDCDGIPNVVDNAVGQPIAGTDTRTLFHQLDVGESGSNSLNVGFKLNNADVYILFDATGTMADERTTLEGLLTTGDVATCAQLGQCCGSDATCKTTAGKNNAANCSAAQLTYCGMRVDCTDTDADGLPNNELRTMGVVGAIRCLVGTAWFGLGQFREVPVHDEPEQDPCRGEGCRYGDRDEQVFRHLVDMTPDHDRVRTALASINMNFNWDEPEGGWMALNSVVTGKGHYFGMNRPAVADRSAAQGCPAGAFGYPCFRQNAIPIVVMFTDAPHHNGPGDVTWDPSKCNGRGLGCPYADLTALNSWTSTSKESASDKTAHFVPQQAERAATAYDVGDIRGRYVTLVGDTTYMRADYLGTTAGCSAADAGADALLHFDISAGSDIDINFHLTKNDAYTDSLYGRWDPYPLADGEDDPTPATDFGSILSLFSGSPDVFGVMGSMTTRIDCLSDAQPATLRNSGWDTQSVDHTYRLKTGTYYVSIKGVRASDKGHFQLQIGETSARVKTNYIAPTWLETRDALVASKVRVIPVISTGGYTNDFVDTAEAQAQLVALASGAVRTDGTPIWNRIGNDGADTGKAIVTGVAELARYLTMDVSLVPVYLPDAGASKFTISVVPQNSAGCKQPHPLLDATSACSGSSPLYKCDTQYECRPGAVPKFRVTFTNPASLPVPPNPSNAYGGYQFKLQLKGDGKTVLAEIPVFIIPSNRMLPPPPTIWQTSGVYTQAITAIDCLRRKLADGGVEVDLQATLAPSWDDLYFHLDLPPEAAVDFELCTADTVAQLGGCWTGGMGSSTGQKVTVSARGSCATDAQCRNIPGYGSGTCTARGTCQFINPAKIFRNVRCTDDSVCQNGPLESGDYVIHSHCETTSGAYGYGYCVASSVPIDMSATLAPADSGKFYSKVRITLRSDPTTLQTPTLYDWLLTYSCHPSL
jgi:hypothetical protein